MKPRTRELIEYGKRCGFTLEPGLDSHSHYVMKHPNGQRVSVAATPGDYRGDRNCRAEMRRKSGAAPPRANAGHYKHIGGQQSHRAPAEVRVDSKSRTIGLLRKEHRELCERIEYCRTSEDRDGAAEAIAALLDLEAQFKNTGVQAPVRSFRVWQPHPST